MRASASVGGRAAGRLVANTLDRPADLPGCVGVGGGILHLRATSAASPDLVKGDSFPALFARARHRSFTQQCARGAGGAD